ncbi:MAG: LemA family protein [Firmicutes bacterium]|nr:LemA family protein [Bacillota bacterium]MBQ4003995.1 LemA family protein [Bacillota bacterium]
MILIIILVIILLCVLYVFGFYNGCIKLRNQIEEAFSTMDVYLKQRYDLIPNLVNTVKGYAEHEQETLTALTEARTKAMAAQTAEQKVAGEQGLQSALGRLLAVAEAYPELKANQNFLNLQDQLKAQEDNIANARKYYNAVVREFNTKIEKMPGALFAGMFGFVKQPLFDIGDVTQRENVTVQF